MTLQDSSDIAQLIYQISSIVRKEGLHSFDWCHETSQESEWSKFFGLKIRYNDETISALKSHDMDLRILSVAVDNDNPNHAENAKMIRLMFKKGDLSSLRRWHKTLMDYCNSLNPTQPAPIALAS